MKKLFYLLVIICFLGCNNLKAQTYCTIGLYDYGCLESDYFSSFSFGSFNQTGMTCTSGNVGYNDYTGLLNGNGSVFTQGYTYSVYGVTAFGSDENVRIWIDYNDDGIFDNSTELLYASSSSFGILSGNITIPLSATTGHHRMRVRLVWDATGFDACELEQYGCVNDYIAMISPAPSCTGTRNPGNTLSTASSVCPSTYFTLSLQNNDIASGFIYQWQSSPDSIAWTNIPGDTNASLTTSQTVATYYRCAVTCTISQNTSYSNPTYIIMNGFASCYCIPATSVYPCYMWISNVTTSGGLINFNNSFSCASSSYTDFSGSYIISNLQLGTTTMSFTSYGYPMAYSVWIDYNDDNIFEPSEQVILDNNSGGAYTVTNNFTVPSTAPPGTHRMRVRAEWLSDEAPTDPCSTLTYGETEDYAFTVIATTPCTGTPNPGNTISTASSVCPGAYFTLSLQNNINSTGISYQWQSSPDNSIWTNILEDTSTALTTSQTISTYYRCAVTCAASQSTGFSNPTNIIINEHSSCYCVPPASTFACSYMWISNVTTNGGISDFNNSSGCSSSSYTDYSSLYIASNSQLSTTNMSFTSYNNPMAFSVWIDFNDDGIFEPSEMVIANSNSEYALIVTDSFMIPIAAAPGTHRMRVRGEYYYDGAPTDPCSQLNYGETEDYAFTVIAVPLCTGTPNPGNTVSTANSVCQNANFTLSLQNNVLATGLSYQWQSSPDNITWTNIPDDTNTTLTISQTVSKYYRCLVTCSAGTSTGISNPVNIIINEPTSCYCIPPVSSSACASMWITNVTTNGGISNFNNTSGCSSSSYSDFSSSYTASNSQFTTTTISFTSYLNPMAFSVWIDFNDDGIFEPSERVIANSNPGGNVLTVTDSFIIPITAASGIHRMRVRGDWYGSGAPTDPCNQLTYGETEDYAFTVIAAPSCTGIPNPGNTISTTSSVCPNVNFTLSLQNNVLATGLTYQWQSSPDNSTWTYIPGDTNATLITSQTVANYYRCAVTCSLGTSKGFSNSIYVIMNEPTSCYCTPTTSVYACDYMWISNVTTSGGISDFNTNSGCSSSSYTDFSNTYTASNSQFATTNMSFTSSDYPMAFSVWIDFNNDGIFEPSERVITNSNPGGNALTVTDSFMIPITATPGTHRMRVRGDWYGSGAPTDPCNQLTYGETEDYAFTVIAAPSCTGIPNSGNTISTTSSVCPNVNFTLSLQNNVLTTGLTYQWQSSFDNSTWTNIPNATFDTLTISQTVSTYYRCSVTCTNSQSTGFSNSIHVIMNGTTSCYCIPPTSVSACSMWISNVTTSGGVSGFNNSSGCASSSYTDYSSSDSASNLQLANTTMSFSSYYNPMAFSVWIDFNDNGIFEPSERVIANNNSGGTYTVNDNFTVPITAASGTHRMRVRGEYYINGAPANPCNQLAYGETEDYAFTVIAATPCTGTPNPGNTISTASYVCSGVNFSLSLQNNVAAGGITYQWQSSPDNSTWTSVSGATFDTLTISQTASTYYQCLVTCVASQSSGISNSVYVAMNTPANCYCIPPASSTPCSMWISNVTTSGDVSDFNNSSDCAISSYNNFSGSYIASNSQLKTSTMSFTSYNNPMAFSVWIDFNDDGIFEPSERVIANTNSELSLIVTDSFTIPITATPGTHRMRVRGEYYSNGAPTDPCNQLMYGETEDYSFTVIAFACTAANQPTNLTLAPSPTTINGSFTASTGTPGADHYLIIRSNSNTLSATPVNGITYTAFTTFDNNDDIVVAYQTDTTFTDIDLLWNTQYYYFVFAANSNCIGVPDYLTAYPLTANTTTLLPPIKELNITAMLQEYYNSGSPTMNQAQDVDDNGDNFNKWSGLIVDTITVQIRSTIAPDYMIEQEFNESFLNTDGTITLSGIMPYGITGYQYIVIKHWKSIETWSDSVDFTPSVINYNFFTNPASTQFPNNMTNTDAYGNLVEGNLIWAGDITNGNDDVLGEQDGYVTLDDVFLIYDANLVLISGYNELDINGDGYVTLDDVFLAYNNNLILVQTVNPITINSKKK